MLLTKLIEKTILNKKLCIIKAELLFIKNINSWQTEDYIWEEITNSASLKASCASLYWVSCGCVSRRTNGTHLTCFGFTILQ